MQIFIPINMAKILTNKEENLLTVDITILVIKADLAEKFVS